MSVEKNKEMLFSVGELAKLGGVTVRTLQYYDKTGLLSPSDYSSGGRRMYCKRDMLKLQQILFLKSLGFSLDDIRDGLLPTGSSEELLHAFKRQKDVLSMQIARIREASKQLDQVMEEIRSGEEIGIDKLIAIIESTRMGNMYTFMLRHISSDQMEYIVNCFDNEKEIMAFNNTLQQLTSELMEQYRSREDPAGTKAQWLAASWWTMMMTLTKDNPELLENMMTIGTNDDIWPSEPEDLKDAIKSFLGAALMTYFKENNINLPFMKEM